MSILTIVAGYGVRLSGVISISSKEHRMPSICCRSSTRSSYWLARTARRVKFRTRHAAVNARRMDQLPLACWAGGGRGERGEPGAGADRGGAAARQPGGGRFAVVLRRRRVLPGRGQGPGEVRDAARAPGRRPAGHRRRRGPRLFARGVLPGAGVVLAGGHVGAARRAARPPRAGEAAPRDRGDHPPRGYRPGGSGRAGRGPVRGAAAPSSPPPAPPPLIAPPPAPPPHLAS